MHWQLTPAVYIFVSYANINKYKCKFVLQPQTVGHIVYDRVEVCVDVLHNLWASLTRTAVG